MAERSTAPIGRTSSRRTSVSSRTKESAERIWHDLGEDVLREHHALDGREPSRCRSSLRQPVDPGGDQRGDAGRHRDRDLRRRPASTGAGEPRPPRAKPGALEEERVALRRRDDVRAHGVRQVGRTEEQIEQPLGVGLGQRFEQQRAGIRDTSTPRGPVVEQLGSRGADQEERYPRDVAPMSSSRSSSPGSAQWRSSSARATGRSRAKSRTPRAGAGRERPSARPNRRRRRAALPGAGGR